MKILLIMLISLSIYAKSNYNNPIYTTVKKDFNYYFDKHNEIKKLKKEFKYQKYINDRLTLKELNQRKR